MATTHKSLQQIMKHVLEAQILDEQDSLKAAYVKYLTSIKLAVEELLDQANNLSGFHCDVSSKKILNLISMCVQRGTEIVLKQIEIPSNASRSAPVVGTPPQARINSQPVNFSQPMNIPGSNGSQPMGFSTPTNSQPMSLPISNAFQSIGSRPSGFPQMHSLKSLSSGTQSLTSVNSSLTPGAPTQPLTSSEGCLSPSSLGVNSTSVKKYHTMTVNMKSPSDPSPLEIAERQNRQLMAAYQARMAAGLNAGVRKTTDMNLGLQRRLAENLALAEAREKTLAKKRAERRRRLEEIAAQRFTATVGMSEDELERRKIYTRILEYEQDNKWLHCWREKLKEKPDDCVLMQDLVKMILGTPGHPLTRMMYGYQHQIYNKIHPLVLQWHEAMQKARHNSSQGQTGSCTSSQGQLGSCISSQGQTGSLTSSESNHGSVTSHDQASSDNSSVTTSKEQCNVDQQLPSSQDSNSGDHHAAISPGGSTRNIDGDESHRLDLELHALNIDSDNLSLTSATDSVISRSNSEDVFVRSNSTLSNSTALHFAAESGLLELQREALMRHLGAITRDIQDHMEKILTMFVVCYEDLNSAAGRDSCYASLEEPFYSSLWGHVLALYRAVDYKEEHQLYISMTQRSESHLSDFNVSPNLQPPGSLDDSANELGNNLTFQPPYSSAVSELQSLAKSVSPLAKLESIVQVSRLICKNIEDFHRAENTEPPNIGADDLLPILSFVVSKSKLPQLIAECHALEDLVHEGYLMGEEGYCLTSLSTAVRYVMTLT